MFELDTTFKTFMWYNSLIVAIVSYRGGSDGWGPIL